MPVNTLSQNRLSLYEEGHDQGTRSYSAYVPMQNHRNPPETSVAAHDDAIRPAPTNFIEFLELQQRMRRVAIEEIERVACRAVNLRTEAGSRPKIRRAMVHRFLERPARSSGLTYLPAGATCRYRIPYRQDRSFLLDSMRS